MICTSCVYGENCGKQGLEGCPDYKRKAPLVISLVIMVAGGALIWLAIIWVIYKVCEGGVS